ncbi:DNA polymerase IV [Halodesulfovibrio marinisediminis]|uniref:DNA polymerase IV n=1 Tax=Halodesulfovibrio marinisediminis DSM 17456 TaxID=1121457 RepID=A0A1N6EWI0_9BACT|nr:DNA polymerase IV [Halodesulfovibrio marinisediminis]SIN87360.1 DNA polymerase-4 [Halodesulfovibrio marinisediminis DSM 17456]
MIAMKRCIMHLDMDAFFASVEQLDHPEWRGKPVIVGGSSDRGVVCAASYEARKFGVHSAMPIVQARKLCPHAIYTGNSRGRYVELSRNVMSVLNSYSPVVEQASIDEAYIDATGNGHLFRSPVQMAQSMKQEIFDTVGLTCSIGIAPVKFLAKIASDYNKPNGLYAIYEKDVASFLHDLPVRKIPGVGKKFIVKLEELGVSTCGQVLDYSKEFWERRFGKSGIALWERSNGIDNRVVETFVEAKSESAENTLHQDTLDKGLLKKWLMRHAERVGQNQRKYGLKGRTITLKLKYNDFQSLTRSKTLPDPTNTTDVIYQVAVDLLDAIELVKPVRLIGVGISNYNTTGVEQLNMLDHMKHECTGVVRATQKQQKLDEALDAVRNKFGKKAIFRGRLFGFDEE